MSEWKSCSGFQEYQDDGWVTDRQTELNTVLLKQRAFLHANCKTTLAVLQIRGGKTWSVFVCCVIIGIYIIFAGRHFCQQLMDEFKVFEAWARTRPMSSESWAECFGGATQTLNRHFTDGTRLEPPAVTGTIKTPPPSQLRPLYGRQFWFLSLQQDWSVRRVWAVWQQHLLKLQHSATGHLTKASRRIIPWCVPCVCVKKPLSVTAPNVHQRVCMFEREREPETEWARVSQFGRAVLLNYLCAFTASTLHPSLSISLLS